MDNYIYNEESLVRFINLSKFNSFWISQYSKVLILNLFLMKVLLV